MKELDYIIENFKPQTIDYRDLNRIASYVPGERLGEISVSLKGSRPHDHKELTRENVLKDLREDIIFGYEKSVNQRGISSHLLVECVKMWMWILDDEIETTDDDYENYARGFYQKVAKKYDIDLGSEDDY